MRLRKLIAFMLLITVTVTLLTENGALASPVGSSATSSGNAAGQLGQIAESAGPVQAFQADLFTGRAQTGIPIFVPPGRKNVQPSLNLGYSSSGGNGWIGMGWGLDMGYIARSTKRGVPKYDSTDTYVFSFQGVNSELVNVATNEYRAKDESLFLKFVYDPTGNKWTVTDKSGTQHTFGDASGNRQANSLGTFKWALCKVKDTSGNYMTITYTTDNGELYLSAVEYNGNETQSFGHTHKVEFNLEDRDDDSFSYITGAKVSTLKRLNNIQVKVKDNGGTYQLARKYVLAYEYSPATGRSRLTSVTEYGKDGTTSLPAVTFVYQDKNMSVDSMTNFTGVARPSGASSDSDYDYIRTVTTAYDTKADFLDINGDGKNDRVMAVSGNTSFSVQLNNGDNTFASVSTWGSIYKPSSAADWDWVSKSDTQWQQESDLADINGDGLPDRIVAQSGNTNWKVQLNNGSGFDSAIDWGPIQRMDSSNATYDFIRYSPIVNGGVTSRVEFFDINGDGLPDRVMSQSGTNYWKVQLNTGSGFASMTTWSGVETRLTGADNYYIRNTSSAHETSIDLADVNGDGLIDRIQSDDSNTNWKVQYNTGTGFTTMEDFGPIWTSSTWVRLYHVRLSSDAGETGVDLFDVNGDGLPDRVLASDYNTAWKVQYNTGTGFTSAADFGTISNADTSARYSYPRWSDIGGTQAVDVADIDGDGIPDRLQTAGGNTWKIQKNKGPYPDLLKTIKNGRGGETQITYSPSTAFDNTDTNGKQRLPFPIEAVTQVDQKDGMGNTYTTTYSYKGGMYDAVNREFRGFREVTVTDAAGTQTIQTFGQGDTNKGRLLEKDVKDSSGNLFTKEVTTWSSSNPFTGVTFTYVSQVDNYLYDGDATYKQTRQTFTYDSFGNLASTTEEGDVSVSTDSRKTVNTYVYGMSAPGTGSGTYIMNTLSKTTLYDTDLTTIKAERYFYYDGASSITAAPTAGLLTKEEEWLNTASGCGTAGVCSNNPKTTMTYDSYGNVATVTDARSYTTTNTYDSTYHLFLVTISNALSQTRSFTYDPWLAQILTSTDQNSQVTETQYDTLGRVTKVIAPLDSSSEPTQEFAYDYPNLGTCAATCTTRVTTKVKSSVPGSTFTQLITYSFTDGLGREIERRSPAEDSSQQIVSGIVTFNSRGLADKQYTPYFASTSTSYVAPDTSKPKATFTYDAVGRRTRIDYPDSTNSQVVFSDFGKTTTDQRGKQLRYTNDAYGRLVTVEEFNGGSTYTTTYEYDVLNNLKKTTDNAGNQTTITYDSLSRKTGMTDPDMGTWSYTYDLNDNLASQTDAKSQTISFTYDALNRVTLKDLPAGETDVTYNYDSAPASYSGQTGYWVGRLAKVTDASGTHEFKYDKQGRVLDDTKTVDSVPYSFGRTYDSMGRVRTLTYPDTEVVTYTYNGFGDVETIQGVKSGVTTDYIKDVNYNASGQITYTKYGNNVTSDYTYDSNTLRLSNILTKKPDGTTKLQDLSYTFDNIGNVSTIADTVNSMSQSFTYDDLNRLTQATGSAYGTQNFAYDSIGNMTTKAARTMSYGSGGGARPHAVTSLTYTGTNYPSFCNPTTTGSSSCTFTYDSNGNMTVRGQDTLSYDSENRLKEMKTYAGESGSTTYTLKPGWNVVSFSYLPDDHTVASILSSLTYGTDYDQVSYYDAASSSWKHWVNDSDFNDFSTFDYGKTYEIYNKTGVDKTFTVNGKSPAVDITHSILSGDNFISPAVKAATNVSTVLSSLTQGTDYSDVKRYNAATQTWESYVGGAFTQFEPGKGYNIVGLRSCSFTYGKTETDTTFVYDSTGARVKKTAAGSATVYLGKDFEAEASATTKHIFLGDRRISTKKSDGSFFFYHSDHINSSNVLTDSSGNQIGLYEYDPYGSTVTHTGTADVKHQFTGQEKDDSTGLYYYGARYMDPELGRFISPDWYVQAPEDPQSLNRYTYARNNPINYTDPTGNFWFLIAIIFAVIAVATAVAAKIAANNGHLRAAKALGIVSMSAAALSAICAVAAAVTTPTAAVSAAAPQAPAAASAGGSTAGAAVSGGTGGSIGVSAAQQPTLEQLVQQLEENMAALGQTAGAGAQAEGVAHASVLATATASTGPAQQISMQVLASMASSNMGAVYNTLPDVIAGPSPHGMIQQPSGMGAPLPDTGAEGAPAMNPALVTAGVASARQTVDNVMRNSRGEPNKDKSKKPARRYRHDTNHGHYDKETQKDEWDHYHYQDHDWDPDDKEWKPGKWKYGGAGAPPS